VLAAWRETVRAVDEQVAGESTVLELSDWIASSESLPLLASVDGRRVASALVRWQSLSEGVISI
jgi:hypothetical protein